MKRLLCVALLLPWLASAQTFIINPFQFAAAPSGPTPVFSESFEGTGYENPSVWSEIVGDPDEDSTEQAADGSQSLKFASGVSLQVSGHEAWTAASVTTNEFAMYYTATDVYCALVRGRSGTGGTQPWQLVNHSGGNFRAYHGNNYLSVALPAANQWVYIRLVYAAATGGGGNGTMDFYVSTTPGEFGSPTSLDNGTATTDQDGLYFRNDGAAMNIYIDDINIYTP